MSRDRVGARACHQLCDTQRATRQQHGAALDIQEQGSFAVGGTVVTAAGSFDPIAHGAYTPAGADRRRKTQHGDHAHVFYQVPASARRLPLVFWHGHGQSGKTWETTPEGREGLQKNPRRHGALCENPAEGGSQATLPEAVEGSFCLRNLSPV
jgi:hypothetical protein